ncbi:MAGE family-domain-containing protein [Kockiozyma suomiensis]|uniref:MAGE family-domain-containing protein n=1 Tax=Kockiozyma suomiensis TaxID=1337062 RepID=UPI003343DC07
MPTMSGRRRNAAGEVNIEDINDASEDLSTLAASRKRARTQANRRADIVVAPSDEDVGNDDISGAEDSAEILRMAKNLVRLALESEHSRTPIRRSVINETVIEKTHRREFPKIYQQAQHMLSTIFGMILTELPTRSVAIRRVSKRKNIPIKKPNTNTNKLYTVTSVLDPAYRGLECLKPNAQGDRIYNGLVVAICSLLLLHGGRLHDVELIKSLRILRIGTFTPYNDERTNELLNLMIKHQYLEREKDADSEQLGTEDVSFTYYVGPRARIELPEQAIADFVVRVYGRNAAPNLRERALSALHHARENDTMLTDPGQETGEMAIQGTQLSKTSLPSVSSLNSKKARASMSRRMRQVELERDDNDVAEDTEEEEENEEEDDDEGEDEDDDDDSSSTDSNHESDED